MSLYFIKELIPKSGDPPPPPPPPFFPKKKKNRDPTPLVLRLTGILVGTELETQWEPHRDIDYKIMKG